MCACVFFTRFSRSFAGVRLFRRAARVGSVGNGPGNMRKNTGGYAGWCCKYIIFACVYYLYARVLMINEKPGEGKRLPIYYYISIYYYKHI